jgi:ABC-type transport system involved in multi-copper enzyme maturation permease subunit
VNMSMARVRAIARKEFRDYRRNRFVVFTMAVAPVVFVTWALISILAIAGAEPSSALDTSVGLTMLFMLLVPATVPATISAYSVVGEREQGTLEPVLTTPVTNGEFLVGKALAALVPTLAISYAIFGLVLACVALFAHPAVSSAVFRAPLLLALALFTPLIAGWSILVGIAVSARSRDVRVAHVLRCHTAEPGRRPGPGGRAAPRRQPGLAGRVGHVRPRAPRDEVVKTLAWATPSSRNPSAPMRLRFVDRAAN